MKRLCSLLVAAILLLTPCLALADSYSPSGDFLSSLLNDLERQLQSPQPIMHATYSTPDGQSYAAGIDRTPDGQSAFYVNTPDGNVILTEAATYLSNATGLTATQTEGLLNLLMNSGASVPEITEEDLYVLANVLMDVLSGVSSSAVNFVETSSAIAASIDLDALLKDLDAAIPAALRNHASDLDPLLAKVVPYLTDGQTITCADILRAWPQLGLSEIRTGVNASFRLYAEGDEYVCQISIMDVEMEFRASDTGFAFSILPAGATSALVFDTDDVLTLASILSEIPTFTESRDTANYIVTTQVVISRTKIAEVINAHAAQIDALLVKYDPWFKLFSGSTSSAPTFTAAGLASDIRSAGRDVILDMTIQNNHMTGSVKVDGRLESLEFSLTLVESSTTTWTATLLNNTNATPWTLMANGTLDARGNLSMVLSSSQQILGANTITLHNSSSYYSTIFNLSTDTDAFHIRYNEDSQSASFDMKLGGFKLYGGLDANDTISYGMSAPGFYADVKITEAQLKLDSTYFGLDCTIDSNRNGLTASGFVVEGRRQVATYTLVFDANAGVFALDIQSPQRGDISLGYRSGEFYFNENGESTVLRAASAGHYQLLHNGEVYLTLLTEMLPYSTIHAYRIRLLQGDATEGDGYTLEISFDSDRIILPDNAIWLSPEEFVQNLTDGLSATEEAVQQQTNRPTPR